VAAAERELAITLSAIIEPLTSGLAKAKGEVKSFSTAVVSEIDTIANRGEKLQNLFKDFVEAFVGVEIVEGLKKIAEAANQATDALEIAAKVTHNFGKDFDVEKVDTWLRKLAASADGGGYSVNELRDAMQQFATTGATAAQQERLVADSIGLAAAKHISLAEATHINMMAATGHVEILGRYGIAVKNAAGETLAFSQILENEENETMGAAKIRAEGLEGAFGRLSSSVNALAVAFGKSLIPAFTAGANLAGSLAAAIAKIPAPVMNTVGAVTAMIAGFTALGLITPAVIKAFDFLLNGILLARDALFGFARLIMSLPAILDAARAAVIALRDAMAALDIVLLIAEAPFWVIAAAVAAIVAVTAEAVRGLKDLKAAWEWFATTPVFKSIAGLFKAYTGAAPPIPKPPMTGLGGADKGAQKRIDDWLTAQKAAIQQAVDFAAQRVATAQAKLEATTAKLEELRAKRDPSKPLGPGSAAEEQRYLNQQMREERDIQAAIAQQRQADLTAAQKLRALAAADSKTGDKDKVAHASALTAEAEKHVTAAIKLSGLYDKIGGAVAKIAQELQKASRALAEQAAAAAKLAADTAYQQSQIASKAFNEQLRLRFQREHIARPATGVETAQLGATEAQNTVADRRAELTKAQADAALIQDQINKGLVEYKAGQDALAAANIKVTQAFNDLDTATEQLKNAQAEVLYQQKLRADRDRREILDRTAGRIPGMTVTSTGGLGAFNWGSVFADAISQSHAFANVMEFVNEIMYTFSSIVNAIEPILDALLTVAAMLVNGFISLWNMIARLVSILGIHLQQLQYINTVFNSGTTNLVTFFHDIPTLNELASGNVGPLGPETSQNPLIQIHYDLQNMNENQKGWFGSILGDLALLGAIDWLTGGKFLSGIPLIGNLFQNVGNFIGQGLQSIGNLFVNGWNSLQNWMVTNLGQVGAGIFNIAAGAALLSTSDKGALGFLEKILGVLEIIQGVAQLFGGGSIFGSGGLLSGLLGTGGTGGGLGGLLKNLVGGGGSAGSFGTFGASAGLGAGGLGTAGAAAAASAADPAIIAAAAAYGVDPATMAAAADAAAQTGLPLSAILGGSGGAPIDVAYSQIGTSGAGAAGGAGTAVSGFGAALTAAGIFIAPFLLSTLLGSGFMGIGANNTATTESPGLAQTIANWTGNQMTVPQAPGDTSYTGVQPGQVFNADVSGGLGAMLDSLLQTPLSSFNAQMQPLVQQLISLANGLTSTMLNDQGAPASDLTPIYDANGVVEGYVDSSGNAAGYNLSALLSAVGAGQRGAGFSSTSDALNTLVTQILAALGGASGVGAAINAATPQIVGTRTAQSSGSAGAPTVNGGVNVTINGATINGYDDVASMASDLGTLTLQSLSQNAYALNGAPGRSTLLAQ